MGLRYEPEKTEALLRGVFVMKESLTYQAILAEGEAKEAQKLLRLWGEERLGVPDAATQSALDAITDVAHLEQLARRLSKVASWRELLAAPRARRRNGRRKGTP
jgi:hypothetical protein